MNLPLPMRNGVSPSYLWLPAGSWSNLFEFLKVRFPDVASETWIARMWRDEVLDERGVPLRPDSPYRRGMRILY
jgi:tRNA pseudouridine32 synthase/23S rRNA pseudouridine746 synthase